MSGGGAAKYQAMTETQLRQESARRLLPSAALAGTKQDMIARLVDYEKPGGGWGVDQAAAAPAPAAAAEGHVLATEYDTELGWF